MVLPLFAKQANLIPWRYVALFLYSFLVIHALMHHSLFADETDPWVMAREAGFYDFVHYLRYAGHPFLWYAVLLPFARLGLPVETMGIINALIAVAVAWLILFRAPFAPWLSIAFIFSSGVGLQYAVVQRGYMLMILVMLLVAVLHTERLHKPLRYAALLALLFNTEAFAVVPAYVLAVFFTLDCIKRPGWIKYYGPELAIIFLGGMVALFTLWPPHDINERYRGFHYRYPHAFSYQMILAFLSVHGQGDIEHTLSLLHAASHPVLVIIPGVLVFLLTVWYIRTSRWWIFFAAWLGWFYVIFTCKYAGYWWHGWLMPVFVMWTLWLYHSNGNAISKRTAVIGCLVASLCFIFLLSDIQTFLYERPHPAGLPVDGGKDMAAFIRASDHEGDMIEAFTDWTTSAVAAYLPHTPFWIMGQNRFGGYMMFSKIPVGIGPPRFAHMLILSGHPLQAPGLRLLHISPGGRWSYYLYEPVPHKVVITSKPKT